MDGTFYGASAGAERTKSGLLVLALRVHTVVPPMVHNDMHPAIQSDHPIRNKIREYHRGAETAWCKYDNMKRRSSASSTRTRPTLKTNTLIDNTVDPRSHSYMARSAEGHHWSTKGSLANP